MKKIWKYKLLEHEKHIPCLSACQQKKCLRKSNYPWKIISEGRLWSDLAPSTLAYDEATISLCGIKVNTNFGLYSLVITLLVLFNSTSVDSYSSWTPTSECFSGTGSLTLVRSEYKGYKMENVDMMLVSGRNMNEKEKGHGLWFDAKWKGFLIVSSKYHPTFFWVG